MLADQEGNYYLIPIDALQEMRIPDEHRQAVESAASGDTQGFVADFAAQNRLAFSGRRLIEEKLPLLSEKLGAPVGGDFFVLGVVQLRR